MRLQKMEIARRQLDHACEIFAADGDFLVSLCLAGAAEEILGKLLNHQGLSSAFDHFVEFDQNHFGGRGTKKVNDELNGARNAIKHVGNPSEDELEIDPSEAGAMISRAFINWARLNQKATPSMMKAYSRLKELTHAAETNPDF